MEFFRHSSTASNSSELSIIMDEFGLDGYAWWFILHELVAEKSDDGKATIAGVIVRKRLRIEQAKLSEFATILKSITEIDISWTDDEYHIVIPELKEIKAKQKIVSSKYKEQVSEVLSYLNNLLNKNFKETASSNITPIVARLREGYSVEDFKRVIDTKYAQWIGSEWEKYLRPKTLFADKFDGYLNECPPKSREEHFQQRLEDLFTKGRNKNGNRDQRSGESRST